VPVYKRSVNHAPTLLTIVAVTTIRFLPKEITAANFLPFCAFVGGISGAFLGTLSQDRRRFPAKESFRGVVVGAIFGVAFVTFGSLHLG
jgi:hypothetical protein